MKIVRFIFIMLTSIILMSGCSTFSEAGKILRNEKQATTDEFLIKKKGALTQQPDFENILKPGSSSNETLEATKEKNRIKTLLRKSKSSPGKLKSKSSSAEKSILNQIKK